MRRWHRWWVLGAAALLACGSESEPGGTGGGPVGGGGSGGAGGGDPLRVETESGPVHGTTVGGTRAFLGIPYAKPPVGALRFRPPQPPEPWTEPREATAVGPICPQLSVLSGEVDPGGAEDCLTLNVWTPDPAPSTPAPVMVWIHGGGFEIGSGHGGGAYTGEHLVPASGNVVVTLNYRLGPFGFLAHPALRAEHPADPTTGNEGMADQVLALEWVKHNIAAFGGDPDQVTIFGESAGGMSVCFHLLSPGSDGLFERALIESGPCALLGTSQAAAEQQGQDLAAALVCDTANDVPTCLRGKTTTELLEALPPAPGMIFGSGANWGPNVDGTLLPGPASTLLAQGSFAQVPVLLGSNRDEGTLFVAMAGMSNIDEPTYQSTVTALMTPLGIDAAAVLAQYPASSYPSPGAALGALLGHSLFNCPTRSAARSFAAGGLDTHLYYFTHAIDFTVLGDLGAFHSSELGFVFGASAFGPLADSELPLSASMMGYWGRFAGTGDPNGGSEPSWPPFTQAAEKHLVLDLTISEGSDLLATECDFWDAQ